jgi:hypothetical protein
MTEVNIVHLTEHMDHTAHRPLHCSCTIRILDHIFLNAHITNPTEFSCEADSRSSAQ